jgi:ribonucleotide monophosphatase NagD (HAD superfamily)
MTNSVETLKHIMPLYDGFIIDLWGVMHDGVTAFPAAIEFVRAARAAGKAVGFLSNSSSRAALVARQLQQMGIIDHCISYLRRIGHRGAGRGSLTLACWL